jgi:5-methyltetrahydrofolate--homocysteine methyltransferase
LAEIQADYQKARNQHANKKGVPMLSISSARANKSKISFAGNFAPVKPKFFGRRVFKNIDLSLIAQYIDWAPFFQTWDLAGFYPAILKDPVVGEAATKVFAEGQAMLKKIIDGRWLTANGVIALMPANTVNDDDIEIYTDETRQEVAFTWYGMRQQTEKPVIDGVARPNQCLADFIAPKGTDDYIGLFAVTGGLGMEKRLAQFEAEHDDYSSIMFKSIADRLA